MYSCGHFSRLHHESPRRPNRWNRARPLGIKSASSRERGEIATPTIAINHRTRFILIFGRTARLTADGSLENQLRGVSIVNDHALSSVFLDGLQRETFDYFVHEANPLNGLVADKTQAGSPASIAAVGFALSSYPVGVERGFMRRADAITRTLATLRFFHASIQSVDVDATRYKGFYYHFLDMVSGRRVWKCELSTIDSAILLAGVLTVAAYFLSLIHISEPTRPY